MSNRTRHPPKNWFSYQRLAYIQLKIACVGRIQRKDIAAKFGISLAQASADIQAYIAANPDALRYNLNKKHYERNVAPHHRYHVERWDEWDTETPVFTI